MPTRIFERPRYVRVLTWQWVAPTFTTSNANTLRCCRPGLQPLQGVYLEHQPGARAPADISPFVAASSALVCPIPTLLQTPDNDSRTQADGVETWGMHSSISGAATIAYRLLDDDVTKGRAAQADRLPFVVAGQHGLWDRLQFPRSLDGVTCGTCLPVLTEQPSALTRRRHRAV